MPNTTTNKGTFYAFISDTLDPENLDLLTRFCEITERATQTASLKNVANDLHKFFNKTGYKKINVEECRQILETKLLYEKVGGFVGCGWDCPTPGPHQSY